MNSDLLKNFPQESLLSILPDFEEVVLSFGKILVVQKNTQLFKAGEVLQDLWIPMDQEIKLIRKANLETGAPFVSVLKRGRSLGLKHMLKHEPLPYEAHSEEVTTFLKINRKDLFNYFKETPAAFAYLLNITQFESVRQFKKLLEQKKMAPAAMLELFSQIELHDPNEPFELEKHLGQKLIFIELGDVQVKGKGGLSFNLTIEAPFFLGGQALMSPHKLGYDVFSEKTLKGHTLSFEKLKTFIRDSQILDELYDEPFIEISRRSSVRYTTPKSKEKKMCGQKIDTKDLNKWCSKKNINPKIFENFSTSSFAEPLRVLAQMHQERLDESDLTHHLKKKNAFSLLTLAGLLERYGMHVRGVSIQKMIEDQNTCLPVLVVVQDRALIVLRFLEGACWVYDPEQGVVQFSKSDWQNFSFLEALEVQEPLRTAEEAEKNETLNKFGKEKPSSPSALHLKAFFMREWQLLGWVSLCSFLIFMINIIPPYIFGEIIDSVLSVKDQKSFFNYSLGLILCFFSVTILGYFKGRFLSQLSYVYDHELSSTFYRKVLELGKNFSKENRMGDVMSRMTELLQVRSFLSSEILNTIIQLLSMVVYSIILFYYSWKVALIPWVGFGVIYLVRFFMRKRIRIDSLKLFDVNKAVTSKLTEMIQNVATLKAFGGEKKMLERYEGPFLQSVKLQKSIALRSSTLQFFISIVGQCIQAMALWAGVTLVFGGSLSSGALFALSMYVGKIIGPFNALASFLTEIEDAKVSFQKLDEVYEKHHVQTQKNKLKTVHAFTFKGKISLKNISFRYADTTPWVLRNLNLTLYPGQKIAIVGKSGCGKTTLAKIMSGLLEPSEGHVFYDEHERTELSRDALASQVGWIHSKSELFAGSLEDNIAYGYVAIDEKRLMHVAQTANVIEFAEKFPTGFKQYLAEGGMGLSGGQRQRMVIARTLYRNPAVLVFDEAMSALDAKTESVLMDQFEQVFGDKTSIIIAHRLSTIRHADIIYVLDQGQLVEQGPHGELVKKRGHYYTLFKNQL